MKHIIIISALLLSAIFSEAQFRHDSSSLAVDRQVVCLISGKRVTKTIAYIFVKSESSVVGGRTGEMKYPLVNLDEAPITIISRLVIMFKDGTWMDGKESYILNVYRPELFDKS